MSGAQLSNYATFLVHPEQAPLSIVLTALSTAAGVFMTPVLALLLLGARIPVDARGMALSITQIVLVPVLGGAFFSSTPVTSPAVLGMESRQRLHRPMFKETRMGPSISSNRSLKVVAVEGASLGKGHRTAKHS